MNRLLVSILLMVSLVPYVLPLHAFTIGEKGRVYGPSIHTSYFLTPNNQETKVKALAYVGNMINGNCIYTSVYDVGQDLLKTGDFIYFDSHAIESIVGGGYSCLIIAYQNKQLTFDTFRLDWDGNNYFQTTPSFSEVSIL